jgi:Fis family transcriptional regulator
VQLQCAAVYFDQLADARPVACCSQRNPCPGNGGPTRTDEQQRDRRLHARSLEAYFRDLRGTEPDWLHDIFLGAAEKPLLDVVMQHAQGNQSKAAEWLGMNRNTLRKKLLEHKLLK